MKCSVKPHALPKQMRMLNFLGNCRCSDQDKEIQYDDICSGNNDNNENKWSCIGRVNEFQ